MTMLSCEKCQYLPTPCKFIIAHLVKFVTDSIGSLLEVILTFDINEYIVKGKLAQEIKTERSL